MCLLFVLFLSEFTRLSIKEPLELKRPISYMVCRDGSFLFLNAHAFYHFDQDGKLIRKIGKKGEGPGEFQLLWSGVWDGNHYIMVEGNTQKVSLFDNNGTFLKQASSDHGIVNIGFTGKAVYVTHLTLAESTKFARPKVISELRSFDSFSEMSNWPRYHTASEETERFSFNNANHWVRTLKGDNFILDELLPTVFVYNSKNGLKRKIKLRVPGFVNAPEKFLDMRGKTPQQSAKWWFSWSRIVGFSVEANKLLVAYEVPHLSDPLAASVIVAKCNPQGEHLKSKRYDIGHFIGATASKYYIIEELDTLEDPFPKYQLRGDVW